MRNQYTPTCIPMTIKTPITLLPAGGREEEAAEAEEEEVKKRRKPPSSPGLHSLAQTDRLVFYLPPSHSLAALSGCSRSVLFPASSLVHYPLAGHPRAGRKKACSFSTGWLVIFFLPPSHSSSGASLAREMTYDIFLRGFLLSLSLPHRRHPGRVIPPRTLFAKRKAKKKKRGTTSTQ